MSASAELRDDALLQPIEDVSTGDPEPRRFLFSPWHLVLIPLAIVMLIPMIWMVITSFETLNETRHFPPILIPSSIQWQNYTEVLQQRAVRAVVPEHARGHGGGRRREPAVLQPGGPGFRPRIRPRYAPEHPLARAQGHDHVVAEPVFGRHRPRRALERHFVAVARQSVEVAP